VTGDIAANYKALQNLGFSTGHFSRIMAAKDFDLIAKS